MMSLHLPLHHKRLRSGFTLLELLLALGISVIVIAAIASAMQIYVGVVTRQQDLIERKQIGRAVIAMMNRDLRAGVQYKPADYSGLDDLAQTQLLLNNQASEATEETEGAGEDAERAEPNVEPADPADPDAAPPSFFDEEIVSFRPAMLGTSSVLMLDISRLPRLDQYNPLSADSQEGNSPSDIKSIAYFFSEQDAPVETGNATRSQQVPGGLFRREIDRAVAAYQGDFSLVTGPDSHSRLLAAEITELRFRYFDGSDWHEDWDSEEDGGFPIAIEVQLTLDPERASANPSTYNNTNNLDELESFRSVIHLPMAEPVAETEPVQ